jgi:hypothetical protein
VTDAGAPRNWVRRRLMKLGKPRAGGGESPNVTTSFANVSEGRFGGGRSGRSVL